jgi:hypothetical protein
VGDEIIAGTIVIARNALNLLQAHINYIDYNTGEFYVGGPMGLQAGTRVQINDPTGRFGRAQSPDPRLTVDADNPTVHATTGYPMCIPRVEPRNGGDSLCPQGNRPRDASGNLINTFTMPIAQDGVYPDARQQAPLEVGDLVEVSGAPLLDARGPFISAWGVNAWVGIYTFPGSQPTYLSIEEQIMGAGGFPNPNVAQEATARLLFTGFTTDPTSVVRIVAIDVNPCTGAENERVLVPALAVDPGPPVGAIRGRFVLRALGGVFLPVTRELRVLSSNGVVATPVANGLEAGQYQAPTFEFIFAEGRVPGQPFPPANFIDIPFMTQGIGPWGGPSGPIVGPLTPFPDAVTLPAVNCGGGVPKPPTAPIANAGGSQTANAGAQVSLNGNGSRDTNSPARPLTYLWTQTFGQPVTLSNPSASNPTFIAPLIKGPIGFALTVSNGAFFNVATATVSIINGQPAPAIARAGADRSAATGAFVTLSGTGSVNPQAPASSPRTGLTFRWQQIAGPTVTLSNPAAVSTTFRTPILPVASAPVDLVFNLTVSNTVGSSVDQVKITVNPPRDTVSATAGFSTGTALRPNAQLIITANSNNTSGAAQLTAVGYGPMTNQGGGAYSLVLVGVARPASVTVSSNFGGTITVPVALRP